MTCSPSPCAVDQLGRAARTLRAPPAPAPRRARAEHERQRRRRRHGRSRADGRRAARRAAAAAWPAPPTVQSTISPAGTGRRSSTTSRTITGRCENSASTSVSSNRFAGAASAAGPVSSPPVDRHRPGCLPGSATAESGRSRGQQPRRPRGWRRARSSGLRSFVKALHCSDIAPSYGASHEVVDALASDDRGRTLLVALAERLRVPDLDVVEVAGHDHLAVEARRTRAGAAGSRPGPACRA